MKFLALLAPRWLKLGIVVLPLLLYSLYLATVAADRYVSEAVLSVRANSADASAVPGAALLLAGMTPSSHEDTIFLREFVHSQALLAKLDARLGLRRHYAAQRLDLPFRLAEDASLEDFVEYYRSRVEVLYDEHAAILTVRSQGFDPKFANALTEAILEESERFVNETSHKSARERMRFAEGELSLAGERLQKAQGALLAFQSKNKLIDPTAQAQAAGALTAELQAARSRLEAELNGLVGFLNDDAYQVRALRGRIAALDKQIQAESERATTDTRRGARLNELSLEFQGLTMQAEIARDGYKLALAAVENARIEATRQIKTLVVIEPPSLPETAEYPLTAYNLVTLLVVCLLVYAIVRLVLATVREHMD